MFSYFNKLHCFPSPLGPTLRPNQWSQSWTLETMSIADGPYGMLVWFIFLIKRKYCFVAGANTECCTVHSRTPLMLAARSDQNIVLSALIDAGANVNARDYERASALHLAAEEGSTECVATLIQAGCDVNAQTRTGDTPIIKTCKGGKTDTVY